MLGSQQIQSPRNSKPSSATMATTARLKHASVGVCLLWGLLAPSSHVHCGPLVIRMALKRSMVSEEVLKARGFSPASMDRLQKCTVLVKRSVEARLQSTCFWLFSLKQSHEQIAEAIATCADSLGCLGDKVEKRFKQSEPGLFGGATSLTSCPFALCGCIEQNMESTVQWLLDMGLAPRQIVKVILSFPEILCYTVEQNSEKVVQLFDLGLDKVEVGKVVAACPELLRCSIDGTIEWFLGLGLTKGRIRKLICSFPRIVSFNIEDLNSKMHWLLDLGMSRKQVVKAMSQFPLIFDERSKCKIEWFLEIGLTKKQVSKVINRRPQIVAYRMEQNIKPKLQWLAELGLNQAQVVKIITTFPQVLSCSINNLNRKVQWLLDLGVTRSQVTMVVTAFPRFLGSSMEKNLKPKVRWLIGLGLNKAQVAKTICKFPNLFCFNIQSKFDSQVDWFLKLGLTESQIAKMIAASPSILALSIECNLKPKVQWLVDLGLSQKEVVKIISSFPAILCYSVSNNLDPKKFLLQRVLGEDGTAEVVVKRPEILGLGYQRLTTRLNVLLTRNETQKLAGAMQMTDKRFKARYGPVSRNDPLLQAQQRHL